MGSEVMETPLCVSLLTGYHRRFKAFESASFRHDGRMFGIHYGSGHLLGVMGRDTLKVHLNVLLFLHFIFSIKGMMGSPGSQILKRHSVLYLTSAKSLVHPKLGP